MGETTYDEPSRAVGMVDTTSVLGHRVTLREAYVYEGHTGRKEVAAGTVLAQGVGSVPQPPPFPSSKPGMVPRGWVFSVRTGEVLDEWLLIPLSMLLVEELTFAVASARVLEG